MRLIHKLRTKLGFRLDEVAAMARLSPARLKEIEARDEIDDEEAERLGDLLGTDIGRLLEEGPIGLETVPVAALLKAQADKLDAGSRFAISEAQSVAREAHELERLLGRRHHLLDQFTHNDDYRHPREGVAERLAVAARKKLSCEDGAVGSMQSLLLDRLGVLLLWASSDPAEALPGEIDCVALTAADASPAILVNPLGKHVRSAFGRRIALAHEMCHVLFDGPQMRELSDFCATAVEDEGRKAASRDAHDVERRARAFALYFLAPRRAVKQRWTANAGRPTEDRVRDVMEAFGVGYEATRGQLDNLELLPLAERIPPVPTASSPDWEAADPLPLRPLGPIALVRPLRAGAFLALVREALRAERISERAARDLLRVTAEHWPDVRALVADKAPRQTWSTSSARPR